MKNWKIVGVLVAIIFSFVACSKAGSAGLSDSLKKDAAEKLFLGAIQNPYSGIYKVVPIKIVYVKYKFHDAVEIQTDSGTRVKAHPFIAEGEGYFSFAIKKWAKAKAHGYLYKNEYGENIIMLKGHERKEWPMEGSLAKDMAKRFNGLSPETPTQYSELP